MSVPGKLLLMVFLTHLGHLVQCYTSSAQLMRNTAVRTNGSVTWYWPSEVLNWAVHARVGQYFKYLRQSTDGGSEHNMGSLMVTRNADNSLAGTHSIITANEKREYMAELVVIDTGPTCSSNATGRSVSAPTVVQLRCEVCFAGNVAPSLRWVGATRHLLSAPLTTRWRGEYAIGKVTLTATVRVTSSQLVMCQAYFDETSQNATCPRLTSILPRQTGESCEKASNTIPQTYRCSTPVVVKPPLGRIYVEPKERTLCVGSSLVLKTLDNYTRVNFMWLHPSTHVVISQTANLTLTAHMRGRRHFIGFAHAHDNVLTSKYVIVNVTVKECVGLFAALVGKPLAAEPDVSRLANGEIVAIALAAIVFATVVISIIYYIYMLKQSKTVDVKLDELVFQARSDHLRHDGGGEGQGQLPPIRDPSRRHVSAGPELRLSAGKKNRVADVSERENVACGPAPRREMSQQTRGKRKGPNGHKGADVTAEKVTVEEPPHVMVEGGLLNDVIKEPSLITPVPESETGTENTQQ